MLVCCRQSIMHLKHIGIVCKNLTIPQTCLPFPVKSLCFQTDEELAAPDGMVVRQLYVDAGYDSFRREQTQKQVWQAYRHDFELPDKDWLPKSKELLSVMRQRLSHVWMLTHLKCTWLLNVLIISSVTQVDCMIPDKRVGTHTRHRIDLVKLFKC